MPKNQIMRIREGGSAAAITATEDHATSVTRSATTGLVVIDIGAGGTPYEGLCASVELVNTTGDRTCIVTIVAGPTAALGTHVTVATFTTVTATTLSISMKRRFHTTYQYVSAITTIAGTTGTCNPTIDVSPFGMDLN